jgi:molecular chaperone GrpE
MSTKRESSSTDKISNHEGGSQAFQVIDKRHFLDLEKVEPAGPIEDKPRYPSFVEELIAKMELTERRFEEKKNQMQEEIGRTKIRLEAEFQRRVEAERQKIVLPFLEVLDNLERALGSESPSASDNGLFQGVELIVSRFRAILKMSGVEAIPVLNQPFDPNLGQAVGMVAVKDPAQDGVVVEELQRGYRIGGQLLRPAQVRVGHLAQ